MRRRPPAPPPPDPPRDPDEEVPALGGVLDFMRTLWAIDHGLQSASKRMEQQLGVTGPQRLVIRIVGRFPDIGSKRLARILHVHPSTLTGVLRRLEERGLLSRRTDPNDGRRVLLSLTALGRGIDDTRSGTIEARIQAALARQPEERIAAARELLAGIIEALEKR